MIPIHETEARILDAAEGSVSEGVIMVPLQLPDIQTLLRWSLYAPISMRDLQLTYKMMSAHHLLAVLPEQLAAELGFCSRCKTSLPCDVCGAGT